MAGAEPDARSPRDLAQAKTPGFSGQHLEHSVGSGDRPDGRSARLLRSASCNRTGGEALDHPATLSTPLTFGNSVIVLVHIQPWLSTRRKAFLFPVDGPQPSS